MNRSLHSAPAHDLPLAVEEVTAGWLTSALSLGFPGVQVTSARHELHARFWPRFALAALDHDTFGRLAV